MGAFKSLKSKIREIPLLGPALVKLDASLRKLYPAYVFTYRIKPRLVHLLIKALRKLVPVGVCITADGVLAQSESVRFKWRPKDAYSLLGYPLRGWFEPLETDFAKEAAKHSRVIIDVGGNFGWYACHLRAALPPGGEIHIFEPAPVSLAELQANLALNERADVKTVVNSCCLSDTVGEVVLHIPKTVGEAFASIEPQNVYGQAEKVVRESTTLERYCAVSDLSRVDLIKIDVEGAELKVLKGAERLLAAQDKPMILLESTDSLATSFGYQTKDVISYLEDRGFQAFLFTSGNTLISYDGPSSGNGYDFIFIDPKNPTHLLLVNRYLQR